MFSHYILAIKFVIVIINHNLCVTVIYLIMISNRDLELAMYIQNVLLRDLQLPMCWGYFRPRAIKNGLSFHVSGLKHQGKVKVIYNEAMDLFDIKLLSEENILKETIEDVYVDELVNQIDYHVEKVENYNEVVVVMCGIVEL
jgi:hypothetical protein